MRPSGQLLFPVGGQPDVHALPGGANHSLQKAGVGPGADDGRKVGHHDDELVGVPPIEKDIRQQGRHQRQSKAAGGDAHQVGQIQPFQFFRWREKRARGDAFPQLPREDIRKFRELLVAEHDSPVSFQRRASSRASSTVTV